MTRNSLEVQNVGTDLVNWREKLTGDIFTFHTLGWLVLMCIRSGTAEIWNKWSTCKIIQIFHNNYLLSIGIYMACIKMTHHVKTYFLSFLLQHPRDFLTLLKRPRSNQRVSLWCKDQPNIHQISIGISVRINQANMEGWERPKTKQNKNKRKQNEQNQTNL